MIADRLFADGQPFRDLCVTETLRHQGEHFSLTRGECGERGILAARRALESHELQYLIAKAFPGGLVLEEDVILRIQLDELSAGNTGSEDVSFCDRGDDVAAR